MYTYRIYLDGGNLVIGTYESNVLKGEAKHLPRGLVAVAGNTNTTITLNRVVNNLPTLANIEHPDLRDSNGNVWGANRTAVIAAINSFIQSTGGGNVISVNGQTGTVSLGLQNLVNVTTITPTQGDVLSYNSSGNWVLNSGLQYLLSKVKSATATQTSLEVDNNYKINIDATQGKTTIVHAGSSVATFGAQKALLPGVTVGTTGNTYDLPATRGTATGQVPVFNASNSTTSFQAVKVADLSGSTDDLAQGATNLFFTSAEQSKLAGIQSGAEVNVNADWNSSSGDSQILNKPTLSTVATSGSYNDLSNLPSIPAAYTDSSVDAHLNTATATTGQILSWTGSDYDWVLDAAGAPAGTVGQLQYNNSGIFGASSNLFWDISNNRLGIGTTTPADLLTVNGNARILNGNRLEFRSTSNTYGARHFLSDSQYRIGTDGANGWSGINISDNNGILLFLSGAHSWRGVNDAMISSKNIQAPSNGYFGFQTYASTNEYLAIKNSRVDGNNEGLSFHTRLAGVNSETMRIAYNGNVGIGTTTPTSKLDVYGGESRFGTDQLGYVQILGNGGGGVVKSNKRLYLETFGGYDMELKSTGNYNFKNNASATYVHFDGINLRVGIGTTTPSEKLHVVGNVVVEGAGISNMFIGSSTTGDSITTGQNIVALGDSAMRTATADSSYVVAVGTQSGREGGHSHGTSIGYSAGYKGAQSSTYVGSTAGFWAGGQRNVGVGYRAGGGNSGTTQSLFGNVSIGYEAGAVLQTAATAVGYLALTALTTGVGNTAVGYQAGDGITTAAYNTLVGHEADVGTANSSTAMGYQASGVGSRVVAIGYQAQGGVITNGYQNVGVGYQANYQGASERSIAIGAFAAYNSTIKSVAVGERAAYNGSDYSVMVGHEAGQNATADNTVAIGYQALTALTTGASNTALGYQAGLALTTGANNTFVGYQAGVNGTFAYGDQVLVGYRAGAGYNGDDDRCVMVGSRAGEINMGAWGIGIGYEANYNTSGYGIIGLGYQAARVNSGAYSINIGYGAGIGASGENSIRIGKLSGNTSTGANTIAIGADSLKSSTANNTIAIGFEALKVLSTGTGNVAIGYQALDEITTGINNTAVGYDTNTSGSAGRSYTNLFGYGANALGNYGTAIGWLSSASTSSVSIGTLTNGNGASQNSIMLGYETGRYSTGNNNVYIGHQTGQNCTTGAGNLFLGYQAGQNAAGSNKLYIENSNSATPLIYGEFDTDLVRINGSFQVTSTTTSAGLYASNQTELRLYELTANGTNYIALKAAGTLAGNTTYTLPTADGSAGQTLTTDASGNMSWAYPKSPVKSEAGTAYTLVLADAGKYIRMTATTAITITIPQDIFAVGDEFFFEQNNTGQVTVAAGTGVTLRNTAAFLAKTAERYAIIGLKCVASNEFILTGERELV